MSSPPEPLTPPDCDLRDFPFMPLDVVRLRDSGLAAKATGDEFRAAVLLWAASWHQIPAASLPNDDRELAHLCGYGRALRDWQKIKAGALRGFILCADGRWYHPHVAAKALEAWESRSRYAEKRERDRERLRRWRSGQRQGSENETNTGNDGETRFETPTEHERNAPETRKTETRIQTGTLTGINDRLVECGREPELVTIEPEIIPNDAHALAAECAREAGVPHISPAAISRNVEVTDGWLKAGIDPVLVILPTIRRLLAASAEPISSLRYFDREIRHEHARRKATLSGAGEPRAATGKPVASGSVLGTASALDQLRGGLGDFPSARVEH